MKNKNLIIAIAVIVIILVGGWFFLAGREEKQEATQELVEEQIEEISAEELGLNLFVRPDKKAVKFEITSIKDIDSVDYELSYLAKGDIPRGVIGHIDVKPSDKKILSEYLDLGSCSRNVCKYDEGVTSVKLLVKITKKDGKIFQASKELEL